MRNILPTSNRFIPILISVLVLIIITSFLLHPDTPTHITNTYSYLAKAPKQWLASTSAGMVSPVVFALICYGEDTAYETTMLIKSALIYTTSPLSIHIISDKTSQSIIETYLSLVHNPLQEVEVVFYPLTMKHINARLERTRQEEEGRVEMWKAMGSNHAAGSAGLMKMFMHEIIDIKVKRALFVDSDAIFVRDPTLLWREFDTWTPEQAMGLPSHDNAEPPGQDTWKGSSRICSCVIMLDLERLRKVVFMDSTLYPAATRALSPAPHAIEQLWGEPQDPSGFYRHVGLGDQGYLYAIKMTRPELFSPVPLQWEMSTCLFETYRVGLIGPDNATEHEQIYQQIHLIDLPQEHEMLIPGILHFNCLPYAKWYDAPEFKSDTIDDPVNKLWGPAIRYHIHFKWIWLNKGVEENKVVVRTVRDLRFLDEIQAGVELVVESEMD